MIGLQDGQNLTDRTHDKDGVELVYDRIELSGRLRDKLFHGSPFRREDLKEEWRGGFDLIVDNPEILVLDLMGDCELEISKWANNSSRARTAAEGRELVGRQQPDLKLRRKKSD